MLQITIPGSEMWDEYNEEFVCSEGRVLTLEHSLVSISKWESNWCKPFLSKQPMTNAEIIDYVRCMSLTDDVDPKVFSCLSNNHIKLICDYIDRPMTATTINEPNTGKKSSEQVTSELIYYWMVALNIPFECQYWHLNRLLTLVRICNIKNQPPKKMSRREILSRNAALNAARRKRMSTKG